MKRLSGSDEGISEHALLHESEARRERRPQNEAKGISEKDTVKIQGASLVRSSAEIDSYPFVSINTFYRSL